MKLSILSIAVVGLLLGSCSSAPTESATIKKGEEFTFDEQKMTVDFKASTVLVNEKEQLTLVAPEGKIYVLVDVTAKNSSYFAMLMDGDKELEAVDFLVAQSFVRDLDITKSPDKSELFLVDIANVNLTINIKSYGDDMASLKVGALKDESTIKVTANMRAFANDFNEGGRVLEAAKKYVKDGVNPADITTENGEPMIGDPINQGLTISNISADGTVIYSIETGLFETVEVTWDGDYISKIMVK
jgi:hypothetical protein